MSTPSNSNYDQVAQLAYEIWERQGHPEGHALDHWLAAEARLSAPEASPSTSTQPESTAPQTEPNLRSTPTLAGTSANGRRPKAKRQGFSAV